jgi:hypothetical protein
MNPGTFTRLVALVLLTSTGWSQFALAATPAQLLAQYSAQAGHNALPERGKVLFTSSHTGSWRCASCHGSQPTGVGQHAATGRPIQPLAPGFNPERFTDSSKVEKWFRRNCNDVLGRECSAAEKADVLSWLISLKP